MPEQPAANVIELHPAEDWPPPARPAAFTGLAGEIVSAIEPHSESDPLAILAQLLVCFGSVIGRGAHYAVEATQHHGNEFALLIGPSARARKGSSWDHVQRIFAEVEPGWATERIVSGLSSGEGLIWSVRDSDKRDQAKDHEPAQDKRLLVLEAEFASVLKMVARDGNTLSPVVRCAWDGKPLQTLTKNSPARASAAHVAIVGHITAGELVRLLNATEAANGFLNRFLLIGVRRSKLLPEGGRIDEVDWEPLLSQLRAAIDPPDKLDGSASTSTPAVAGGSSTLSSPNPRTGSPALSARALRRTSCASRCSMRCSIKPTRSASRTWRQRSRCGSTRPPRPAGCSATVSATRSPTRSTAPCSTSPMGSPAPRSATCSAATAGPKTSARRSSGSPPPAASMPSASTTAAAPPNSGAPVVTAPPAPDSHPAEITITASTAQDRPTVFGRLSRIALRRCRHVFNDLSREKPPDQARHTDNSASKAR